MTWEPLTKVVSKTGSTLFQPPTPVAIQFSVVTSLIACFVTANCLHFTFRKMSRISLWIVFHFPVSSKLMARSRKSLKNLWHGYGPDQKWNTLDQKKKPTPKDFGKGWREPPKRWPINRYILAVGSFIVLPFIWRITKRFVQFRHCSYRGNSLLCFGMKNYAGVMASTLGTCQQGRLTKKMTRLSPDGNVMSKNAPHLYCRLIISFNFFSAWNSLEILDTIRLWGMNK